MSNNQQTIEGAVERNVGAVISLPSVGMLRHHKSRFLALHEGGLVLEMPKGEEPLINELITTGAKCGISFRGAVYKVIFAVPIRKLEPGWKLGGGTEVSAILVDFPEEVKSMQRRADYRVAIPPSFEISARIWRIAPRVSYKELPSSTQELNAEVRNISLGGIGVRLSGKDGQPPLVTTEDRLRLMLKFGVSEIVLEGRLRPSAKPDNPSEPVQVTGIQFKKLESDMDGRRTLSLLTRLVGDLQRQEARNVRLGLTRVA
jgi:hypothetical protein